MTSIKYCTIISLIILFIYGCDGFLNESPTSQITPNNFYSSKNDYIAAVNDIYSNLLQLYNIPIMRLTETTSDIATLGYSSQNISDINLNNGIYDPEIQWFYPFWIQNYRGINRANMAIKNIQGVTNIDSSLRDRLVAESKFLRGLYYFNLVRAFGDVPLRTEPTQNLQNLQLARTPKDSIYSQIINDFQSAGQMLPVLYEKDNVGRATKGAAMSLLTKVYLSQDKWQKAAAEAKKIIDSGTYSLFRDYADLWKEKNENNVEFIFSVQYKADVGVGIDSKSNHSNYAAPRNLKIQKGNSYGEEVPTLRWYNSFRKDDYRKKVNFATKMTKYNDPTDTLHFEPMLLKFFDRDAENFNSGKNWPIIRYADVLLMYADASNEASGPNPSAYNAINKIRNRAKLPSLTRGLTQAQFRDSVYNERKWELGMEGHRWFDLVREKRLVSILHGELGLPIDKHNRVYPIPQRAIDSNPNLTQNPGY